MSPTQRTLKYLRDNGYIAVVVASWNPFSRTRKDVLCGDILAFGHGEVLLVNATDSTSVSKREAKAKANGDVQAWASQPWAKFVVAGWRKGVRGDDALIWRVL